MVQCGAVLERENGVDGFRVYLAVTWEVMEQLDLQFRVFQRLEFLHSLIRLYSYEKLYELINFIVHSYIKREVRGLQRSFNNSVIFDGNFARRPRVKPAKQRRIKGRCISGKLDPTFRSTDWLVGNVLCLSISEQGVDECQQASPAGANTVQGFASLQLLSKRRFAAGQEGVLYHNETAARTEMDSGDYEAPVSGHYNHLLTRFCRLIIAS
ncbi:Uncharacterized protein DBV15_05684 [Temnothorax longispinosus]|uniref:Uncharacterized protein n=1 Tax=Temnothorax longispinosus TaxID=300112 RepID=A0A4V3S643_9HYME|nr:Uncharacterized protein DBV15_05684 [Temnothorax longispinosus]